MNAYMMREFSERTISGLRKHNLFKLILPPFKSFLEINLDKEVDKHREIITLANAALIQGRSPADADTELLLQKSLEIDQAFLHKAAALSSAIDIHYSEINPIRRRRIEYLLDANYKVLAGWDINRNFRGVIAGLFNPPDFGTLLRDVLYLYIEETRVLSKSVKIPRKLTFASNRLIDTVHTEMKNVADKLAVDLANTVFRRT